MKKKKKVKKRVLKKVKPDGRRDEVLENIRKKLTVKKPKKDLEEITKQVKKIKKAKSGKEEKKKPVSKDIYFKDMGDVYHITSFYSGSIDYEPLFAYLGSGAVNTEDYASLFGESSKKEEARNTENELFNGEELENFLRKQVVANLIGVTAEGFDYKDKEKFNNYAMFNKIHVMVKYQKLGLGEKPMHAPGHGKG